MKIGVFGGSFNPVHNGHIAVAREAVAKGLVDKVMMVMSPMNPLKENPLELIDDDTRMEMLRIACAPYPELEASDIELGMPRPSYSISTLQRLAELHPADSLRLIIGADNWEIFPRWRESGEIIRRFDPIVYPREGYSMPQEGSGATPLYAELHDISSTEIREKLIRGEDVSSLLPAAVLDFIRENGLYRMDNPTPVNV